MPVEYVVTAAAGAVLAFVFLATVRSDVAIKASVLLSMATVFAVPATRLAAAEAPLRVVVPAVLVSLTTVVLLRSGRMRLPGIFALIALYLLLGLIVALAHTAENAILIFALTAATLVSAVLQGLALQRSGHVQWALRALIALACALSAYALFETLQSFEPLWRGARIRPDGQSVALSNPFLPGSFRAQATFGHPLPLALVLVAAIYVRIKLPSKSAALRALTVLLLITGIFATGSRNALVLTAMVLVLVWANRLRGMRIPVYAATIVAGVFGILAFAGSDVVDTGSFTHRLGAVESVGRLIFGQDLTASLFGNSEGGLPTLYQSGLLQNDGLAAVDNQLIYQLATSGVIGTVIIAAIGFAAWKSGGKIARGLLLILIAQSLIFDLLGWPSTAYLAWFVIGSCLAVSGSESQERVMSPVREHARVR